MDREIGSYEAPNVSDLMPLRDQYLARIEVTMLSIMFTVTVVGNVLVLTALGARKCKLSRMYYFILHLCISDLIVAFFHTLPQLIMDVTGKFIGGYPGDYLLCKFVKFMQLLGPYLSSYVLVVTAIDRYQAICFPLKNCSWTPRRSKIMIGCAWLFSGLGSIPQVFIFSYRHAVPYEYYDCWADFIQPWGEQAYVMWSMIAIFLMPLVILVFTYTAICKTIWVNFKQKNHRASEINEDDVYNNQLLNNHTSFNNRFKKMALDENNEAAENYMAGFNRINKSTKTNNDSFPTSFSCSEVMSRMRRASNSLNSKPTVHPIRSHNFVTRISRAKVKTVKLTIVVIVCYIACSLPYFSSMIYVKWISVPNSQQVSNVGDDSFHKSYAFTILSLLVSLNSCVNPWLYLIFNENLVITLKDLFKCRLQTEQKLISGQICVPFSHSSLSESRLATILTLSRIPCNQVELKTMNNLNAVASNSSFKVPKTDDSKIISPENTRIQRQKLKCSKKIKNENVDKITYPGHNCEDSRLIHNCDQV